MKKYILLLAGMLLFCTAIFAQTGTAYGFKGGLTLGSQNWNGQDMELLFAYHGALSLESRDEELGFSLFGDLGWHRKGSRRVFQSTVYTDQSGNERELPRRGFKQPFDNVMLVIGAKKTGQLTDFVGYYYGLGVHADYNMSYDIYFGSTEFFDQYINKFTYGGSVLGGLEYLMNDTGAVYIEVSFHPDLSKQIFVPEGLTYISPLTNQQGSLGKQEVTNFVLEFSVGYKIFRWN